MRSPSGTAVMHGWPSGVSRRLDRRVGPVQPLVAFFLPAVGGDVLVEVALRVHEADADERHAEVARLPCSDRRRARRGRRRRSAATDAARTRRRSRRSIWPAACGCVAVHQVLCAARAASSAAIARRRARGRPDRRGRASSVAGGIAPQHPHRVVRGRPPQRVVEPAEHLRAPGCQLHQRSMARSSSGDAGGSGERICSWAIRESGEASGVIAGRSVRTRADERREPRQIDVAARDDGDDLAGAGAPAQRRRDRAARPRLPRSRAPVRPPASSRAPLRRA